MRVLDMNSFNKLMDINEISEKVGLSLSAIYKMIHQRRIPFVKVGRLVRFDPIQIKEWIEDNSFRVENNSQ